MSEKLPQTIIDSINNSVILRRKISEIDGMKSETVKKLATAGCVRLYHLLGMKTAKTDEIQHQINPARTISAGKKSLLPVIIELAKENWHIGQWSAHQKALIAYNVLNAHWLLAALPGCKLEQMTEEALASILRKSDVANALASLERAVVENTQGLITHPAASLLPGQILE